MSEERACLRRGLLEDAKDLPICIVPELGANKEFEISENFASRLMSSRDCIIGLLEIEHRYQNFVQSFLELETEVPSVEIRNMMSSPDDSEILAIRPVIELRTQSFLSAARAYHDHANSRISNGVVKPKSFSQWRSFFSDSYDRSFDYRLVEKLRNVMQHSASVISEVSIGNDYVENAAGGGSIEVSCSVYVSIAFFSSRIPY